VRNALRRGLGPARDAAQLRVIEQEQVDRSRHRCGCWAGRLPPKT
jgi:hypothetical protein